MARIFTKNKILLFLFGISTLPLSAQFTNVSTTAGITMTHDGESINEFMDVGSGVAWLDYNQDGEQDLYITMRDAANLLYENNGDGTFTDVAASLGVQDASGDGAGVAVADFNNDGWPDIYLANGNEDILLKSNGGTSFTDITSTAGLTITGTRRGTSASWGDYDNDGFLDLYVSNHRPVTVGLYEDTDLQDFLFHNNGDETFTDVSAMLGISDLQGHGFIGGWTDYDNDGDSDLIVINDCSMLSTDTLEGTKIFRNDGGSNGVTNWDFTEVAVSAGVVEPGDPTISDCRNGMGIAVGDFNRDGWMDFYYTNIGPVVLYKNDGDGTFTNVSSSAGVETQLPQYFSWGASFVDYDLDGYQDIMTAIGSLDLPANVNPQPNMLFRNNGDETFTDVAPSLGIDDDRKTRNIVFSDYDKDGDPDFLMMNYGETPMLMKNEINNGNHYLIVDLDGVDSNKDGIGSKLKLTLPDGTIQYFETRSGSNLGGGDAVEAYFGLGTNDEITELEITWPAGTVQALENVAVDQRIVVVENAALPVELASFEVKEVAKQVQLDWATFSEKNNAYFSIQRSANGTGYEEIGTVDGNGTTEAFSSYTFLDTEPLDGQNYYRIRQVDHDGTSSFSAVRTIEMLSAKAVIKVSPNPVRQSQFTLSYTGSESSVDFEIFDVFGKRIMSGQLEDQSSKDISVAGLANGLYLVRLSGQQMQHTEKLILNR